MLRSHFKTLIWVKIVVKMDADNDHTANYSEKLEEGSKALVSNSLKAFLPNS